LPNRLLGIPNKPTVASKRLSPDFDEPNPFKGSIC
jgi:hypothetical protein